MKKRQESSTDNWYMVVSPSNSHDLDVIWNVNKICQGQDGVIVQHVRILSTIDAVKNDDYYEAWPVKSGSIMYISHNIGYDDRWSSIPSMFEDMLLDEGPLVGSIKFTADVYFVPQAAPEFCDIIRWEITRMPPAWELMFSRDYKEDLSAYYLFPREKEWKYDGTK